MFNFEKKELESSYDLSFGVNGLNQKVKAYIILLIHTLFIFINSVFMWESFT